MPLHKECIKGTGGGGKSRIPDVMAVISSYYGRGPVGYSTMGLLGSDVKAYDNKTALLKSVLKTVTDSPPLVALMKLHCLDRLIPRVLY